MVNARNKRLILSITFLLGLSLTGIQSQNLYVKKVSGTKTAILISDINKIIFSIGNLTVIKTDKSADTYALNELKYINFKDLASSIEVVEKQESKMKLYMNSAKSLLNIQYPFAENERVTVSILSVDGRVLYCENVNEQNNGYQVNISMLPKGIYMCLVNSRTRLETTKFLKQ